MAGDLGSGGNLAGIIKGFIRSGSSIRGALATIRDPDGPWHVKVADATFRSVWHQVEAGIARAGEIAGLPGHRRPEAGLFSPWAVGREGTFVYQTNVFTRQVGSGLVIQREVSITSNSIISVNNALGQAIEIFEDGVEDNPEYEEEVLGANLTGLWLMTGAPS